MTFVDSQTPLRVDVARLAGRTHVATVTGELDGTTAERLREALLPLADEPRCSTVLLDLAGVTFVDSVALGVIAGAATLLRAGGGTLVVVSDDPRLRRVLDLTGLLGVIELERTLAEAVENVVARTD